MPQMGVSIAEATVLEWKKQPGETVQAAEPLLEISTDKAESEVPAPVSGRLAEVMVDAGETVDVGTVLARIEPEGAAAVQGNRERAAPPTDGDGSPPVTPVVRRMAEQHELDLSQIEGSGRRGRVTKKDVMAYLRQREEAPAPAASAPEPVLHLESPYREEPAAPAEAAPAAARELSPMRKRIAEHMVRSLRTAAHCTTIVEADMSRIEAGGRRRPPPPR